MSVIDCPECGHEVSTLAPFCPSCKQMENKGMGKKPESIDERSVRDIQDAEDRKIAAEIDNTYKAEGKPMRRFYLNRMKDETGVSRTGRVLEGVLCQNGVVITQWRPPHSTIGIYSSMKEFLTIHVDCHPSCSEVVWLDKDDKDNGMDLQGKEGERGKH